MTFGTFLCRIWSFFTEFAQDSEKWNHCQFRKFVGIFTKTYSSEAFKSMVFNLFSTWSVILLKFYKKKLYFSLKCQNFCWFVFPRFVINRIGINATSITQPFNKNGDFVGIFQTSFVLNLRKHSRNADENSWSESTRIIRIEVEENLKRFLRSAEKCRPLWIYLPKF